MIYIILAILLLIPSISHSQITADGWTLNNPSITGALTGTEAAAPATPASGKVIFYAKSGTPGEFCAKDDAGVETCMSAGGGGGGGEANTASNLGGGLANYSTKVGVDLQFNSFAAADFDLASNLFTIDSTKWLTIAAANAAYQPLDADLTSFATVTPSALALAILDEPTPLAWRISIDAQQLDTDLTSIAALSTTTGGRSILATTPADDQVYVGDSASAGTWRSIPDCDNATTSKVLYDTATNTFSCGTDQTGGGGAGYADIVAASLAGF